ncbi:hypothetical protein BKA62DRAFT_685997 [Auriculariales sp. MPI-PUGE-AT-0066]|nr:hypothetical protein BKA62DRAFT_685997 [Auriculariales sp. MPI-PUGE-AT-0066]
MSTTIASIGQTTSTPDDISSTAAQPASSYPAHVVLILAVLAALLITLAFNAAIWYWCLTHRYARKRRDEPDQEAPRSGTGTRAETPMWGNADSSVSKLSFHESESSTATLTQGELEQLQQWRWPRAMQSPSSRSNAPTVPFSKSLLAEPIVPLTGLGATSLRAGSPLTVRTVTEPTVPKPMYSVSPSSRSASPLTIRPPRTDFSPAGSRSGTPSRLEPIDLTVAYSMPYDHALGLPLPSPPPPGGLSPAPPRLPVRTATEMKERGRRSPLTS